MVSIWLHNACSSNGSVIPTAEWRNLLCVFQYIREEIFDNS